MGCGAGFEVDGFGDTIGEMGPAIALSQATGAQGDGV